MFKIAPNFYLSFTFYPNFKITLLVGLDIRQLLSSYSRYNYFCLFFHVFSEGSMAGMYEKIFRLLWYSAMPCADLDGLNMNPLLKECSYSGKKYK